jgi:hypothetical protein
MGLSTAKDLFSVCRDTGRDNSLQVKNGVVDGSLTDGSRDARYVSLFAKGDGLESELMVSLSHVNVHDRTNGGFKDEIYARLMVFSRPVDKAGNCGKSVMIDQCVILNLSENLGVGPEDLTGELSAKRLFMLLSMSNDNARQLIDRYLERYIRGLKKAWMFESAINGITFACDDPEHVSVN